MVVIRLKFYLFYYMFIFYEKCTAVARNEKVHGNEIVTGLTNNKAEIPKKKRNGVNERSRMYVCYKT